MKPKEIAIGLLIMGFSVNSCHRLCGCDPVPIGPDTMIDVVVKNDKGEDMLNPATSNFFKPGDMILYYADDGKKTIVPTEKAFSVGRGVQVNPDLYEANLYQLAIFSNSKIVNNQAVTFLEFKGIRTDTLNCFYSGLDMTEIKVNGKTTWNAADQQYKTIEIIVYR